MRNCLIFEVDQIQVGMSEQDLFRGGKLLPMMEEFYTLQGEGFNTGIASYFVRIGGCDIGCSWCDSKRSWNPERHPLVDVESVITRALNHKSKAIVVTGGEPSLYQLGYLTEKAYVAGFRLFLETSGVYELSGSWDWICLSPKKQSPPRAEYYNKANELKVIISDISDFDWAEEVAGKVDEPCHLFLQPEWSRREEMMKAIIEYILINPKWRISIQTHKVWGIP